jgi:hypothetical protein
MCWASLCEQEATSKAQERTRNVSGPHMSLKLNLTL